MTNKQSIKVIKVGGAVIEDAEKRSSFLKAFAGVEGLKILVHGGGRTASEIGSRLGIQPNMVEGRRVTDDQTIDVVTMVYGGLVNKQLVASLQSHAINAIGLSGADGNLIKSAKRPITNGIDYGWVGDPEQVNHELIANLLDAQIVPVVAPLTHDGAGHLLNTNADTIASILAVAMSKNYQVDLIATFELEGVYLDINDPDSLLTNISQIQFDQLKDEGKIHSGMIPKLQNAFNALHDGVNTVRICKFDQINTSHGSIIQI
ncbi:MAG: acetylglutamate kinase [Cyclobacteriaceae bacterium]